MDYGFFSAFQSLVAAVARIEAAIGGTDMATLADNVLSSQQQLAALQATVAEMQAQLAAIQGDTAGVEPHLDDLSVAVADAKASADAAAAAAIASKDIDTQILEQVTPTAPPQP